MLVSLLSRCTWRHVQCATALLKAASRSAMFKKETFPTEFSTSAYYLMRSALFPTVGNKNSCKNVKNIPCKGQGLNSTSFARGGKIKALIVLAIRVSVYVAIEIWESYPTDILQENTVKKVISITYQLLQLTGVPGLALISRIICFRINISHNICAIAQ